jgi:YhcH/YjgK/YiaL family protein
MAVFGPLSTVRAQLASDPRFKAAFDYVAEALNPASAVQARIGAVAVGATDRHELAGGSFALEQAYLSKPRAEAFLESHRKYIDVQVMVAGEEVMEVDDIDRLVVSEAYNPERDFIKYADKATASRLILRTGDAAIFYPMDGHMPGLQFTGPVLVRKTVVKVPVW